MGSNFKWLYILGEPYISLQLGEQCSLTSNAECFKMDQNRPHASVNVIYSLNIILSFMLLNIVQEENLKVFPQHVLWSLNM